MTLKEIQELVKLINKSNLTEFKMKDGEFELSIRTDKYEKHRAPKPVIAQQPALPAVQAIQPAYVPAPAAAPEPVAETTAKVESSNGTSKPEGEDTSNYIPITSPIVGTFYRSPSPEKPIYVKVGDTIEEGTVVCIIEAMKLFNEIESEISGKIVKVMVEDAQPVEYEQVLFLVDPNG